MEKPVNSLSSIRKLEDLVIRKYKFSHNTIYTKHWPNSKVCLYWEYVEEEVFVCVKGNVKKLKLR